MPCNYLNININYHPFGTEMSGRRLLSVKAKYGYQGSLKDNEISGEGNDYTTHFRALDTRLGKWFSMDPVNHAWVSPYISMGGNPIMFSDKIGDDLDVGKSKESKSDIKSLAKTENQKFINIDETTGKVTVDFGTMTKDDINKILKKDEGLNLVNDLVTSNKKFYYSAAEVEGFGNELGTVTPKFLGKDPNGIINASDNGKDSNGSNAFLPKKGYNGQVVISNEGHFEEPDKNTGSMLIKRRSSLVFHELAENYERTNNGADYNGNKTNGGFGAHYKANQRESNWWNKSNNPGVANYISGPDKTLSYKDLYIKYQTQIEEILK
ncbi:MAG: hypothetical protein HY062_01865 [Bacteroidetes bacterium]|nr:hypothetical protein [Bacteroidota bacterium]